MGLLYNCCPFSSLKMTAGDVSPTETDKHHSTGTSSPFSVHASQLYQSRTPRVVAL